MHACIVVLCSFTPLAVSSITDWPVESHDTCIYLMLLFFDELLLIYFTWVVVVATKAESLGYILLELLPLTHQGAIQHCGQ